MGLSFCPSDSANKFDLVKDLNWFVRRLAWKAIFQNTKKTTESEEALAFFKQTLTKKGDFRAIRDLMELLNENSGMDKIVEFDYKLGEFVEVVYTTPVSEPLPFWKKSTKFPQLQNFPHLVAFLQKVMDEINKLGFAIDPSCTLTPEQTRALQELSCIDTVVVKPSDKGGEHSTYGHWGYYDKMCFDILRNDDLYRTVPDS